MLNSLRDVLNESVRDLYSAESQLIKALPRMAKAASNPELKSAFTAHLEETRQQAARLEKVCELLGVKPKGKTCQAMKGLIEEGAEIIAEKGDPAAKDAALIGAAQKIEHYEIAGYGTAKAFATILFEDEVAQLLDETLQQEKTANETLTALAETFINDEADVEEDDSEEVEEPKAKPKPAKSAQANGVKSSKMIRQLVGWVGVTELVGNLFLNCQW